VNRNPLSVVLKADIQEVGDIERNRDKRGGWLQKFLDRKIGKTEEIVEGKAMRL